MGLLDGRPLAPKFSIIRRGKQWLLLAPESPNWLRTNFDGALLVTLCDGECSIRRIAQIYSKMRNRDCVDEVTEFFEKLDAIGFFSESSNGESSNRPLTEVYLNLTNKCNMRCPYCYMSAGAHFAIKEMSFGQIVGIIDQIQAINGAAHVVISGGEPLLRDDVYEIIAHLHRKGLPSTLITNGSLISRQNVEKLGTLTKIQVSLDGSNAEVHERTRENFEAVWQGIRVLKGCELPVVVSPTISTQNYDDIPALRRRCRDAGIRISYCLVEPFGRASQNAKLVVTPTKVYELLSRLSKETLEESQDGGMVDFANYYRRRSKRKNCGMGRGIISIAPNGDVFPCHVLHRDELRMGNLLESPLENILRCEDLDWMRVDVDEIEGCAGCDYRYLCGGGCRAHGYWKHGTFRRKYPFCDLSMRCIEHNLTSGFQNDSLAQCSDNIEGRPKLPASHILPKVEA